MDMEHGMFSTAAVQSTPSTWSRTSVELTGFNGPSHYHLQKLLGEEKRKPDADEWPASLINERS